MLLRGHGTFYPAVAQRAVTFLLAPEFTENIRRRRTTPQCATTEVSTSTQPSILRGTVNEYQLSG